VLICGGRRTACEAVVLQPTQLPLQKIDIIRQRVRDNAFHLFNR
jgi:hypothetical protein